MSGEVQLLELVVANMAIAIVAERVSRVDDVATWMGDPPDELAVVLGESPEEPGSRIVVLATASGEIPFRVQAVRGVASVPPTEIAPLTDPVRRQQPALLALVTLPSGPTLIVDPDALVPRPGASP